MKRTWASVKATLAGQPVSQWEAGERALSIMASNVGALAARTNLFRAQPAALAPNPAAPAGMSRQRMKSFVEGGASRSSSQRCSQPPQSVPAIEVSAKRPLAAVVPLQAARQRPRKTACFSQLVEKVNGVQAGHSQGFPLATPASTGCEPPAQQPPAQPAQPPAQQKPVADSHVEDIFDWGLGPPPV